MTKRIVVKTGEYEKDGKKKGEYTEIGVILSNSNGEYILLDPSVNLAGVLLKQRINLNKTKGSMVMASIFDNQGQQPAPNTPASGSNQGQPMPDDEFSRIPF